jgi:hypothetical protein
MIIFDKPYLLFAVLFLASLAVLDAGYRISARTRINDDESHHEQITSLRDSLLVLLSLLVGFTFSMAVTRFELRRQLVIDEANAIGTTSLRAATLPEPQQAAVTQLLRQYADARADFALAALNSSQEQNAVRRSKELQKALWEQTAALSRQDRSAIAGLFIVTVNETIDLSEKRLAARENRIPVIIWTLITVIALLASFTTGYGLKRRFWFPAVMMPLMFACAVALIADLDSPTHGFIRTSHNSLVRLQQDLRE